MLYLHVTYTVKPGQREAFYKEIVESGFLNEIRANPDNVRYDYFYSCANPDELFLVEGWKSVEAAKKHAEQPYRQVQNAQKEKYTTHTDMKQIFTAD